jgi:hypothetical protein
MVGYVFQVLQYQGFENNFPPPKKIKIQNQSNLPLKRKKEKKSKNYIVLKSENVGPMKITHHSVYSLL